MPRLAVRDFGTAIKFGGGVFSSIALANRQLLAGEFTISGWFNWRQDSSTGFIFGDTVTDIKVGVNAGGWFIRTISGGAGAAPTPAPVKGKWNFFVLTRNADNKVDFYFNGGAAQRLYSDVAQPGNFAVGYIGRSNAGQYWLNKLDNISTWNRALTASELSNLYYGGVVPTNGLTLHYKFDEGSGTTATDSSVSGNTGTYTGDVTYTTDVPMKIRTASTNRLAIRNFKSSLKFTGVTTEKVEVPDSNSLDLTAFTLGAWVTLKQGVVGTPTVISKDSGNTGAGTPNYIMDISTGCVRVFGYAAGAARGLTSVSQSYNIRDNKWHFIVGTFNGTIWKTYLDGILKDSLSQAATLTNTAFPLRVGVRADVNSFTGSISNATVVNQALTQEQITGWYQTGICPITPVVALPLDAGTGTTALDTSGNGNNGTITGATYSADVPMKSRQEVNANLVKNGDFEYAPPFVAATNTATRFIDGTALGSTTNNLFGGWAIFTGAILSSAEAKFDNTVARSSTTSMKLSTLDATGVISIATFRTNPPAAPDRENLSKVLPNTSYTASVWIKTNNVVTQSVWVDFRELSGAMGLGTSNLTTKITGTTDWTQYTVTFTTAATARYISPLLRINLAGNISDAWFDDIVLKPTTLPARVAA